MMKPTRTVLSAAAATVALAALVVGSPAIAVLLVAIVALIGLQFAGRDRPIAPTNPSITRRWYLWLGAATGAFLLGLAVVAIDSDGELATAPWATWLLSWAAAAVLGIVGLALGAARLIDSRH